MDNIKTENYTDIKIKGSIVIQKEWFDKFRTTSISVDGVIITNEDITPHIEFLEYFDINSDRIRIRNTYTPTSTSDINGNIGTLHGMIIIYVKTNNGW